MVVRTNEGGTVTPSRPKFSSIEMNPHRHTCIVYSSAELLQDVPALVSTLQTVIATEAAFTVEQDIVAGQGTGGCLGVLSAACTIEVEPESGQAPATVRPENLTKMIGRLWPACHSRAVWLMSIDAFAQIADASFSNGQAVVQYQGNRRFILGCELLITEYTNALGERGDVVLADFGEYIIADRGQSFLNRCMFSTCMTSRPFVSSGGLTARQSGNPRSRRLMRRSRPAWPSRWERVNGRRTSRDSWRLRLAWQPDARLSSCIAGLRGQAAGLRHASRFRRRRCGCSGTFARGERVHDHEVRELFARGNASRPPAAANVAVVPMRGVALYDTELFPVCYSTRRLAQVVTALAADPSIATIVLDCDSPGGSCTGVVEAADAVYAAAKKKRSLP